MFSPPTKEGKGNLELHKVDILKAEYHHFLKKGMEKTVLQLEKVKYTKMFPLTAKFWGQEPPKQKSVEATKPEKAFLRFARYIRLFLQSQIQRIKQMALKI